MKSLHNVLKPGQIVTNSVKIGVYQESGQQEQVSEDAGQSEIDSEENKTYYALISEEKRKILEHARDQARQSAAKILEEAYAQRDRIVNMASEESVRIRKQAYTEGFEEGLTRAEVEIKQQFLAIDQSLHKMDQGLAEYENETTENLVELALHMTEKILIKHIEDDETVLVHLAEKAILSERDKSSIIVHLSDSTMELIKALEERLSPFLVNNGHFGTIKLRADHVPAGTLQIETEEGIVDASVGVQLENLKKQLAAFGSQS